MTAARLSVFNPTGPQMGYRMTVRTGGAEAAGEGRRREEADLHVPARGIRRRGPAGRTGADATGRLGREHARRSTRSTRRPAFRSGGRDGGSTARHVPRPGPGRARARGDGRAGSDACDSCSGAARTDPGHACGRRGSSACRDAVMGAGGSIAVGQRSGGGDWLSMMALCDAFDAVVMLATPGLPKRARLIGLGAAGSAVLHLLPRPRHRRRGATTPRCGQTETCERATAIAGLADQRGHLVEHRSRGSRAPRPARRRAGGTTRGSRPSTPPQPAGPPSDPRDAADRARRRDRERGAATEAAVRDRRLGRPTSPGGARTR